MDIKHEDDGEKGEFYLDEGGTRVARLQYKHTREGEINAYHTEVDGSLEGQGVGKELVAELGKFASEKHLKVHATCSYANKVMSRSKEYKGLLI